MNWQELYERTIVEQYELNRRTGLTEDEKWADAKSRAKLYIKEERKRKILEWVLPIIISVIVAIPISMLTNWLLLSL